MSTWKRLVAMRVSSDAADRRFGQLTCFAAGPLVLICAVAALRRHAATPAELVIGLLAALSVTLLFLVVGLLLPQTMPAKVKAAVKPPTE